jgi:hypothetical protein
VQRELQLQDELDLPAGFNPRTLAWAAALLRDPRFTHAEPRVLAQAVLQHIRTAGFTYTLAPGTYGEAPGGHAIDEFWLDRREGFCEHFAAAFVVVMRAMDVPARIVTGYQGSDPLPVDGYHLVRQSSAHAWAEYWQPGVGWVRADPTAAVAPDRILRSRRLAPPPGLVAGALGSMSPALMASLREGWDLLNNRWNQWVLNYSRGQQLDLLQRLGFETPRWEDLTWLLAGALSSLALAGAAWAGWDRQRVNPWGRQMNRLRAALRRLGMDAADFEAPASLARRVREHFGAAGDALANALDAVGRERYGRAPLARPHAATTRRALRAALALRRAGPPRPTRHRTI